MSAQIEKYEKLLQQYPGNELARFSLGKALYDLGKYELARDHFKQALSQRADWMVVQILIGKCDLSLGDKAAAKIAFQRALQLALDQHHEGPQMEMEQALAELA